MKPQDRIITFQHKLIEENLDVALLMYSRSILYYTGTAQPSYLSVQPENFRLFVRSGLDFALQEVFIDRENIEEVIILTSGQVVLSSIQPATFKARAKNIPIKQSDWDDNKPS